MKCEKCQSDLSYGAKYCNDCGEKVPEGVYDEEYNKTIWAKFDWAKDKYDSFFLKKITGSIIFKIITLVVILIYFFFTMYGNFMGIRFEDSEAYKIQYNKKADEYYILPYEDEANLDLYVPLGTDDVVFKAFQGGMEKDTKKYTTDEYIKKGYTIRSGEYDYIIIDAVRNGKSADKVKVIVTGGEK